MAKEPRSFQCPECGGAVAMYAASCPHCGYRPPSALERRFAGDHGKETHGWRENARITVRPMAEATDRIGTSLEPLPPTAQLGHVGGVAIPRMTALWKIVVVAVAVLGFLYGYVGSAGSAVWSCASVGQCLQYTVDQGFPGFFHSAALIPAAKYALLFTAVVYLLFLIVYGIRKAFHWERQARVPLADTPSPAQPAFFESVASPVATAVESNTQAPTNASPTAVRGAKGWTRPTPLLLAVGVALAWGILSVGPSVLAYDLYWTISHDDVTPQLQGNPLGHCPMYFVVEADGMCHERWDGDPSLLVGDVIRGGENGLLAFLAIGAGLLLWPRLRAGMQDSSPTRAASRTPTLDLGTSDQPGGGPVETVGDKLRQLAALRDDGIISSEEFEAKKAELLRSF